MLGGARILDADPPALRRRGDGVHWAERLAGMDAAGDVLGEVARRGAVQEQHLRRLGLLLRARRPKRPPASGFWVIGGCTLPSSRHGSTGCARQSRRCRSATPWPRAFPAVRRVTCSNCPMRGCLPPSSAMPAWKQEGGHVRLPGSRGNLGAVGPAVAELERRLTADAFHAPEADELAALGLGARELAAAERTGRLLRLRDGVVLLPTAPALAMRELARLEQPFTTSQARQALGTTRRVAVPLLEYLDSRGWTRRLDAGHRIVAR